MILKEKRFKNILFLLIFDEEREKNKYIVEVHYDFDETYLESFKTKKEAEKYIETKIKKLKKLAKY